MERERDLATGELNVPRQIQQSLYPSSGTNLPGFDIAGAAYSANLVCGDYYDFCGVPGDRQCLAVSDVCGDGLPAALTNAAGPYKPSELLRIRDHIQRYDTYELIQPVNLVNMVRQSRIR